MIDKNQLRIGDYVLTSAMHPLACAIRARTAGIRHTFSKRIANHAGIVFSLDGSNDPSCLFIAEMLSNIRSTSFAEYERAGYFGAQIIMVRRNPLYDDDAKQKAVNDRMRWDLGRAVEYDYKGILEYLWPKAKDRPDEFYCSEYLRHQAQLDGGDIIHPKWTEDDDIPPYGIQTATNLTTIWTR